MKGSSTALVRVVGEKAEGHSTSGLPIFGLDCLPGRDSNLCVDAIDRCV
jgi:hypothetical protein